MSTTKKKTAWFGMKVTPEQKKKIKELARRRGVTQTKAVMDLVEEAVAEEKEPIEAEPGSILERNRDLCGAGSSDSSDVSANVDKYLERWGFVR